MQRTTSIHDETRLILDGASLGFIAVLLTLAVMFPSRVPEWKSTMLSLIIAGLLFGILSRIVHAHVSGVLATSIYTIAVLSLLSFFFNTVSKFQHVVVEGWMDDVLLSWERSITGTETTHILERLVSPALTEWMMCAYVLYMPLLLASAIICYRTGGSKGTSEYLLNLSLANILCFAGFIAFPVAGPMCHELVQYTVPLQGGVFTLFGEWIRSNVHYPGGCLPSPHCAATTVMIAALHRYSRQWLMVLLPILATVFPATVYGRYHYLSDAITGIVVALVVLKVSPIAVHYMSRRKALTTLLLINRSDHQVKEGV